MARVFFRRKRGSRVRCLGDLRALITSRGTDPLFFFLLSFPHPPHTRAQNLALHTRLEIVVVIVTFVLIDQVVVRSHVLLK